jgi:phosphatidylserine synthase
MTETASTPPKRRRGIYLLPNLFTTGCLFAGFYAILAAIKGNFEAAAIAIFVAMIMDGLDGRVARLTNTQSEFGAEYDSLSDMVAFGVAPALVMYLWALSGLAGGLYLYRLRRPASGPLQYPDRHRRQTLFPGPAQPFGRRHPGLRRVVGGEP